MTRGFSATCRTMLSALALAGALATAGCGGDGIVLSAETDEPLYREGQQLDKQGRTQEALNAYLKVIAKRGDQAPESHLDAGLIYLYHIKDPIDSIYYFRKYLELQPNSRQAVYVRGLIDAAKREFASSLPGQPLENQSAHLDLIDQVNRLQNENNELKAELLALRTGGPAPVPHIAGIGQTAPPPTVYAPPVIPVSADESAAPISVVPVTAPRSAPAPAARSNFSAASSAPAPSGRTHAVVKGDTLFNLAQRYYGNRSRWRDILAANRAQLSQSSALRIGMVLKIP